MLLDGIIQFSAAAVCMWGISIYKNTIKASLGALCINMIYWYSYVEIYIKRIIFDYTPILDDAELSGGCMLYYIKDGRTVAMYDEPKHNQPIPFPEDMDALVYTTPTLHVVVLDDLDDIDDLDDTEKVFDLHNTKSLVEFINITVTFEDDPVQYEILLRSDTINFYAIGNHINKYIIWSLVLNQHNVLRNGRNYTIQLIDHNVNIVSYTQDMSIVIQKDGYYAEQSECQPHKLVCGS